MSFSNNSQIFLIAGGNGFIGSHVARALFLRGYHVRIADINPTSCFEEKICNEMIVGNICDPSFCERITRGVHTILHFAATMGGMGTIHEQNDFIIYAENSTMTINLLTAAVHAGAKRFFYASSACVYPASLQGHGKADVSLRESDIWTNPPPQPQGLYGLEKLVSEFLLQNDASKMKTHIARFHNIFGPRGAWCNGREKVPAALIRKAIAASLDTNRVPTLEVWGDGQQRRSFLFIDDCVDAILLFLNSDCTDPLNIGSDHSVTIKQLAKLAVTCAGISPEAVELQFLAESRPVGVGSRNSNNELVKAKLGWTPKVSLKEGMELTALWMRAQMEKAVREISNIERSALLEKFHQSQVIDLAKSATTFAILLPITSRGLDSPKDCLRYLQSFARSLARTTWRDTQGLGGSQYRAKIYLAIDHDDYFLLRVNGNGDNAAQATLYAEGVGDITTIICDVPKGHVCTIWKQCARRAWEDGCDYFVLMGDDVELGDEGWMRDAHAAFATMAKVEGVPHGFGCVAFTDTTFPGMPTFPIIHRTHMDIFGGEVIPDIFINQDGDPFLFQLYRRWGCSRMFPCRISNLVGGSVNARYRQQYASDWTFEPLNKATDAVEAWLAGVYPSVERKLTIDVVIPCYRVQLPFLE
ncbi:hypothetical protein SERLA73DRAFT_108917, partial [Serpula lacrymans var. lacrymans S7.3]